MFTSIRPDQLATLRKELDRRYREEAIREINSNLRDNAPDIMNRYAEAQQHDYTGDVLDAAWELGITSPEYLLNWSFIRFATNLPFHRMPEFEHLLRHPLLHPEAKGRHIVLAFSSIVRMATELPR
jgi:hypothetical protein